MKKLLSRLVLLPVGLLLVLFLVANRHPVAVRFDPFSYENPSVVTPALPLWVWLVVTLLIGFFTGAATSWASTRHKRLAASAEHKELVALRREREAMRAAANDMSGDNIPVLKAS